MTTSGVAELRIARDERQDDAALDGVLLKQTGLLATLVTARRETAGPSFIGHAELMRLVKSQQSLLSSGLDRSRPVRSGAGIDTLMLNDAGDFFAPVRRAA